MQGSMDWQSPDPEGEEEENRVATKSVFFVCEISLGRSSSPSRSAACRWLSSQLTARLRVGKQKSETI